MNHIQQKRHPNTPFPSLHALLLIFAIVSLLLAAVTECFGGEPTSIRDSLVIPPDGQVQVLDLTDETTLIGRIESIDADSITFRTEWGSWPIAVADIEHCITTPTATIRNGEYWYENPDRGTGILMPTARLLSKGTVGLSVLMLFPNLNIGVFDQLNIGGGMFPGMSVRYWHVKAGFEPIRNVHVAIAGQWIRTDDSIFDNMDYFYAAATWEMPRGSLTCSVMQAQQESPPHHRPVAVGGELRMARNISLISEIFFQPSDTPPVIGTGIQFLTRRSAGILGVFKPLDHNNPLPYMRFFIAI
jgi:hypothetical protein